MIPQQHTYVSTSGNPDFGFQWVKHVIKTDGTQTNTYAASMTYKDYLDWAGQVSHSTPRYWCDEDLSPEDF